MHSDVTEPLNLGSDQMVSINQLVDIVEEIAGVKLRAHVRPHGAQGRARAATATTTAIRQLLGWAPSIRLEHGMEKTYAWIYDEIQTRRGVEDVVGARSAFTVTSSGGRHPLVH